LSNKIILVVSVEARKSNYLRQLDKYDVSWNVVESLRDAVKLASIEPHNGILIDMPLMIRKSVTIKIAVDDLLCALPGATLNFNTLNGELHLLPRGDKSSDCTSIDQFIGVCAAFSPKLLFFKKRVPLHYNTLLDISETLENPDRTVCIDISVGGCYLFCVREDIDIDSTVWIKFVAFNHENPIEAKVRWICKWGATDKIPGIGVEFNNMPNDLQKKIGELIDLACQ